MENKKKIIMMSALLLVLVAVVIGITYAVYTFTGNSNLNTIDLGRISMSYTEPSNAYVLDNALPMTDEEGKGQNNYFEFTVTSHATTKENDSTGITIPYEINISDIAIDEGMLELSKSLMKVNLVKVDGMTENEVVVPTLMSQLSQSTTTDGAMVVYQTEDVHKNGSTTITSKYRLRAWITPEFDASNTDNTYQYKFRVNINGNVEALKPIKYLRTEIMNQGVVSSGDGLYVSTQTNDGRPTYYYHGAVENNYVDFAGLTWRVVRINEDGTVKIILDDRLSSDIYFNRTSNSYEYMYYSASDVKSGIKKAVDDWYASTLETDYDDYIATTNFCEAAKVKYESSYTSGNATMEAATNYTANFKCEEDGNGKQYVSEKAGLITIDEVVMAGIPFYTGSQTNNRNTYLQKNSDQWTMSPGGYYSSTARAWYVNQSGYAISIDISSYSYSRAVYPVISLNVDTVVTGSGASGDMWVVQEK